MPLALRAVVLAPCALFAPGTHAQNLVPNPSFEEHTSCPDLMAVPCPESNQIDPVALAVPWQRGTCSSPDYYHTCAPIFNYSVPNNFQGSQVPGTGDAYVGIWANSNNPLDPWHEYVTAPLLSPLLAGVEYEASMYVSMGDDHWAGCDRLGMHFSPGPLEDTVGTVGWLLQPQVVSTAGVVLNDTTGWTLITGSFIANGGEDHITIGNFFSLPQTTGWGYYYVDDVSLTQISWPDGISDHARNQQMFLGPNPMVEFCDLRCTRPGTTFIELLVFNALGRMVRTMRCAGCTSWRLERGDLSPGWYSVQVRYADGSIAQRSLAVE